MRTPGPLVLALMIAATGAVRVASAGCDDTKKKIVFWMPNWFEFVTYGDCEPSKLTMVLYLADDLYGFPETEIRRVHPFPLSLRRARFEASSSS